MAVILERSEKRCWYSCETVLKVQTAESASPALYDTPFGSAVNTIALHCDRFNRQVQTVTAGTLVCLTVTDMLMNYTWCMLLHTKQADKFVHTYLVKMY